MLVGTRVLHPEEVGLWDAEFLQITVYHGMKDALNLMRKCVHMCREKGVCYVIHPVEYFVLDKEMFKAIKVMAEWADLAIILHDEKTFEGKRLSGKYETRFKTSLDELRSIAHISFENARDTHDVRWFWNNYADSITLDIGHVEVAGINSIEFVKSLSKEEINKIQYVHIHRNNGWRNGLTDHWPLHPDCREVRALKELLIRKQDIGIILEINETELTEESLQVLRTLRDEVGI